MAEIVAIVQLLASVAAVWLAYRTIQLAHLKMTADVKTAVSAIERREAQLKKLAMVDLSVAQNFVLCFVRDFKIVRSLRER